MCRTVTLSAKNDNSRTVFSFVIVALFILLHGHRISVYRIFLARRTKLYLVLFPLRQKACIRLFFSEARLFSCKKSITV